MLKPTKEPKIINDHGPAADNLNISRKCVLTKYFEAEIESMKAVPFKIVEQKSSFAYHHKVSARKKILACNM